MRYLFIGGPAHGTYRDVASNTLTWLVPNPIDIVDIHSQFSLIPLVSAFDSTSYTRRTINFQGVGKDVFTCFNDENDTMLSLLDILVRRFVGDGNEL